jgi:hypothetical protein
MWMKRLGGPGVTAARSPGENKMPDSIILSIIAENGKNAISRRHNSAENAFFTLFSQKIWTWQTMPLKVGIVATFRGLLSD